MPRLTIQIPSPIISWLMPTMSSLSDQRLYWTSPTPFREKCKVIWWFSAPVKLNLISVHIILVFIADHIDLCFLYLRYAWPIFLLCPLLLISQDRIFVTRRHLRRNFYATLDHFRTSRRYIPSLSISSILSPFLHSMRYLRLKKAAVTYLRPLRRWWVGLLWVSPWSNIGWL